MLHNLSEVPHKSLASLENIDPLLGGETNYLL